jgi:hypothetical protein
MALTLLRFFEVKTPLLPVTYSHPTQQHPIQIAGKKTAAAADLMPSSTEDYILLYTETGELTLRPVVIPVSRMLAVPLAR